jgi:putative intracellular protease/amidase/alpha/beta superfamily hydrolase
MFPRHLPSLLTILKFLLVRKMFLALGLCLLFLNLAAQKRILFVTSNQHFYGNTKINTANHFGELVVPYDFFRQAGIEVDFMSPKGGAIHVGYIATSNPTHKKYLYDGTFMNRLANTMHPSVVVPEHYSAIYYGGGGAAMFGVAEDTSIQRIARAIYNRNGVVSTLCHGTAGIAYLKDEKGNSLYSGRKITGYPDSQEDRNEDYYKTFPFAMDKAINDNQGNFVYSEKDNFYVVDGRFITGQDPTAAESVAKEIIKQVNAMNVGSNNSKSDLDQVRETLMDYIEGTANGQPERLRKAFHPQFNLYAIANDTLWTRSGEKYISNVIEGERSNRLGRIIDIDIEKDAATVKVEIIMSDTRIFTDYFLLLKYKGSWKIIHKSYTSKEVPKSPQIQVEINNEYYDPFMGDYVTPNNEIIVVGRSKPKLYVMYDKTLELRGLNKVNDNTWTAGKSIVSNDVVQTYKFKTNKIEIYENDKLITTAIKKEFYTNEKVKYNNANSVKLGGTLFLPKNPNGKAVVLVHGAGAENRNGYASNLRILADQIARTGITVLTYDKQGIGESEGKSYETFGYAELAQDALAGIDYLRSRKDLLLNKIGLVGIWQGGKVNAKAVDYASDKIDFVANLTASPTQDLKSDMDEPRANMECKGGYSEKQILDVIKQRKLFFDFIENPSLAKELDELTKSLEKDSLLSSYLMPSSDKIDLKNRNQWYTTLELDYDPLPTWKNFNKPLYMQFNEFENYPQSYKEKKVVDDLKKKNIQTAIIPNAQHGGFETTDKCNSSFYGLTNYHKDYFAKLKEWLTAL